MNIGIFSGSFNPVHVGHLILANYIVEFTEIDEVWFVVSPQSPLKQENELSDEKVRLKMVELALRKYDRLKANDIELSMPKPSYTIDTLTLLKETYPQHNFTLIIGADNWLIFPQWKDSDKILENFRLKVYPRLGSDITVPNNIRENVDILDSPIIDVSSTFIRESISKGKNMRSFLTDDVYEYILMHKLYK